MQSTAHTKDSSPQQGIVDLFGLRTVFFESGERFLFALKAPVHDGIKHRREMLLDGDTEKICGVAMHSYLSSHEQDLTKRSSYDNNS